MTTNGTVASVGEPVPYCTACGSYHYGACPMRFIPNLPYVYPESYTSCPKPTLEEQIEALKAAIERLTEELRQRKA